VIYVCESCLRARATKLASFSPSAEMPAASYRICGGCVLDLTQEGEITDL
jgi:hypothetical protein